MSRLIVKNLPPSVNDTKLKEIFSEKGIVTDVQLKYTKDGKFRRFGFVGFKTEEQAQAALNFFHKTCIDTARITVELCAGLGDASKPKSWSKYAQDSTAHKNLTKSEEKSQKPEEKPLKKEKPIKQDDEIKSLLEKHKDDPLFAEFMETHGADGSKIWGNDTEKSAIDSQEHQDPSEDENSEDEEDSSDDLEEKSPKIADKKLSDLEYMESLKKKSDVSTPKSKDCPKSLEQPSTKFYTVKLKGLGYNHKKKHIKQFFNPLKAKSIRVPQKIKGIAYVGFATEKQRNQALNKDKSFLEGKRIFITKYEDDKKSESSGVSSIDGKAEPKWKKQEEALKDEEAIAESGRMFVRNLSYSTTEDDLRKVFEKYGQITEVNLPVDKVTRKLKGFGTVTFMMPEHAAKAYSELDGSILNGRMLHLLPGKSKTSITDLLQTPGLTFKEKKELERKATANSSHNWNTLFLGQNTVVEAIASTYNTTKDKVLEDGGKGTSVAVRLALGETQLVAETRKFLEENGVQLDAFNQASDKRSKTIILVKNLPPGTKAYELREKFQVHGEVGRVVMPPSGVTALIEFLEPSEARKAFTRLAYTKFKHIPLYLEWAPDNSLIPRVKNEKNRKELENNEAKDEKNEPKVANKEENEDDEEDEEEPEPDTTLFVKNLNFSTDEETLNKYFSKCGRLHYATITTKKDSNNPGQKLSMGYGFVRYKFKSDADRALKELQSTTLDGKTLELKRSERTLNSDVSTTKKTSQMGNQTGTKILIKNIPFQANADEITELFKAFGELKAVRLPKKLVGQEKHRGFGFVEYYTKSDSKRAFKALCQSTHLYGRRLVLEWAQTMEDVDDIRKRTAKHFHQEPPSKRSKKATLDPESVGLDAE
ncbi:probable RNA-binding protein 19 [Diachasmimorpha longicaudata]|uniref:probable RNA-binding protein 19 n=1 Tax=Diachasmimorpha longicaudata TaxID=58733 RepID=UPI0030B8AF5F